MPQTEVICFLETPVECQWSIPEDRTLQGQLVTKGTKSKSQMDVDEKDEMGAGFELSHWRFLKTPYTEYCDFRNVSSYCSKTSEIRTYETAVMHESAGMYMKQYITVTAFDVISVIFTARGFW
jgi:hypothetical protein